MRRAGSKAGQPSVEAFVENLPGNVFRRIRRPDGTYAFEYLSSGLFRQFGIDHERLLGEHTIRFDWVHPDDRNRMVSDLEVSAATLGLLDHRIRVVGQDDRVHWARGIGRPSRRDDGTTVWDGLVIDVTREVEAEAALRLAKEEADRAHQFASRLVTEATRRLGRPVRELGELLDRPQSERRPSSQLIAARVYQGRLAAALEELTPITKSGGRWLRDGTANELTPRQQEVHQLLVSGYSNKMIAKRLSITPGTVKLHVAAVLRTLCVSSRRHLRRSSRQTL